jgi:hypothetical protein
VGLTAAFPIQFHRSFPNVITRGTVIPAVHGIVLWLLSARFRELAGEFRKQAREILSRFPRVSAFPAFPCTRARAWSRLPFRKEERASGNSPVSLRS